MPCPVKPTTREFYSLVITYFNKVNDVKEYGVKKHTANWCYAHTAKKFFRSPKTIENIVFGRT